MAAWRLPTERRRREGELPSGAGVGRLVDVAPGRLRVLREVDTQLSVFQISYSQSFKCLRPAFV
jgi:hypothetical protein